MFFSGLINSHGVAHVVYICEIAKRRVNVRRKSGVDVRAMSPPTTTTTMTTTTTTTTTMMTTRPPSKSHPTLPVPVFSGDYGRLRQLLVATRLAVWWPGQT